MYIILILNQKSLDYTSFLSWIRQNTALLEYFHDEICPLQWITNPTLQKIAEYQLKTNRQDPILTQMDTNSQFCVTHQINNQLSINRDSVTSLFFDTDRSISPIITEEKAVNATISARQSIISPKHKQENPCKCSLSCFKCKNSSKSKGDFYPFEKYFF